MAPWLEGRVRQQSFESISRQWPLDDDAVEEIKNQIRMQLQQVNV